MQLQQVNDGVWYFTVAYPSGSCVGYAWSRMVGAQRVETFASTSANALWFDATTTLTKVPTGGPFTSRNAFLSWACSQLGGNNLYWWELTSNVEQGTWSCKTTRVVTPVAG